VSGAGFLAVVTKASASAWALGSGFSPVQRILMRTVGRNRKPAAPREAPTVALGGGRESGGVESPKVGNISKSSGAEQRQVNLPNGFGLPATAMAARVVTGCGSRDRTGGRRPGARSAGACAHRTGRPEFLAIDMACGPDRVLAFLE
jgi:hypothetical protein